MYSASLLLQVLSACLLLSAFTSEAAYLPSARLQGQRIVKRNSNVPILLRTVLPGGSVAPRNGLVRKPQSSRSPPSIRLLDLTPIPAQNGLLLAADNSPKRATVKPTTTKPAPKPASTSVSSLPVVRVRGGAKKITECRRKPKYKPLSMAGCETVHVDVGFCQGACRSREIPGENLMLSEDDAFAFVMQRKCRTCRAVFETRHIPMSCTAAPSHNSLNQPVHDHITTVAIKVVKTCSCMKCPPK